MTTYCAAVWQELAALFYPRRCVGCGYFNRGLCHGCRRELLRLSRAPAHTQQLPLAPGLRPLSVYSLTPYTGLTARLLRALKHRDAPRLAQPLGAPVRQLLLQLVSDRLRPLPPVLVPLPSRAQSVRRRGYNHLRLLLRAAGARAEAVYTPLIAAPDRQGQVGLSAAARMHNAARLRLDPRQLDALARQVRRGREVVLFDDVCTTGASLRAAAQKLTTAGIPVSCAAVLSVAVKHAPGFQQLG